MVVVLLRPATRARAHFGDPGGDDGPVRPKFFLPLPPSAVESPGSDFVDLESPMTARIQRAQALLNRIRKRL